MAHAFFNPRDVVRRLMASHRRFAAARCLGALLCICALSLWACGGSGQNAGATAGASDFPRAGEPDAEEQACSRDTECTLVDDCCGCARGGLRTGVRSDRLDGLTERSADACEQRTCADQPSAHRSCSASAARCVGGRCLPAL
jgi:hypothetical protein